MRRLKSPNIAHIGKLDQSQGLQTLFLKKLPRPKPVFTSEGNLRGGRSLWLIMITPTRWCGIGMSAHLATPRSHKFRIWKSLYYFSSY